MWFGEQTELSTEKKIPEEYRVGLKNLAAREFFYRKECKENKVIVLRIYVIVSYRPWIQRKVSVSWEKDMKKLKHGDKKIKCVSFSVIQTWSINYLTNSFACFASFVFCR